MPAIYLCRRQQHLLLLRGWNGAAVPQRHGLDALILVRALQLARQMVLLVVVGIAAHASTLEPHRAILLYRSTRAIDTGTITTWCASGSRRAQHLGGEEGTL